LRLVRHFPAVEQPWATTTTRTELPDVSLPSGGYDLVQEAAGSAPSPAPLRTPDLIDDTAINLSGTAGKVALVIGVDSLGCNGPSGNVCDAAATSTLRSRLSCCHRSFVTSTRAGGLRARPTDEAT
jgi:hypothetical protein